MKILVTGANGFIGSAVVDKLMYIGHLVTAAARNSFDSSYHCITNIDGHTDWSDALCSNECVIHTAARVHVMRESVANPLEAFREVNVTGTLNLARQSVLAGVKRFIFISTVKVNGESTEVGVPFTAGDVVAPQDPYAISKLEAEAGLLDIARETDLEVVIIRPPLVYGSGVKGNFARLAGLVERGIPLPFRAVCNKRSLVGLNNLVDLIVTCIEHPSATNQVFLAADGQDLSTTEMLECIAQAKGVVPRLIPVSPQVLRTVAVLLGKEDLATKLLDSLQVDISKSKRLLGWEPPFTVEEEFKSCFSNK